MNLFQECLKTITSSALWEAQWLEMLSQMEYVGCRKIVKAVPFHRVDLSVLQHIAEEASHAFMLRKVSGHRGPWRESSLGNLGFRYFRELDERISSLESQEDVAYPLVSWAIERRVLEVYPLYLAQTKDEHVQMILQPIVRQEERHGSQFDGAVFPGELKAQAAEIENELWHKFVSDLHGILHS